MRKYMPLIAGLLVLMLVAIGCTTPQVAAQTAPTPTPQATPIPTVEQHPWIGVMLRQLSAEEAAKHNLGETQVVVIVQVLPHGPAAEAGLLPKDVIVSIGGSPITTVQEVVTIVQQAKVGDKLAIAVIRGEGKQQATVQVTVGDRPRPEQGLRGQHGAQPFGAAPGRLPSILGRVVPELRGLGKVAPKDRFDHFLGGEFSVLDSAGNTVRVQMLPGIVGSVDATTLNFTPNGSTTATSLTVGADVPILNLGMKLALADLKQGDKIVALLVNGQARLISVGADAFAPMLGPMPGGIDFQRMMPGRHKGSGMSMPGMPHDQGEMKMKRQRGQMGLDKPQASTAAQGPVL